MNLVNPFSFGGAAPVVGGLLFAWGTDTTTPASGFSGSSSPVQIGTARWLSVVTSSNYGNNVGGDGHTLGIQADGSLWAWGSNASGQLGLSNTTDQTTPQKVGALSWKVIACSGCGTDTSGFSAGILTDGSLYIWGANTRGQIGDSTIVAKSSPVHVGTSSWIQVACGGCKNSNNASGHTVAVRLDGGLFTWGANNFGQLGDGSVADRSSPVQVGALSWQTVSAYGNRDNNMAGSGGILADGSLYMWGNGSDGRLGDGTAVSKSSPVHIGTSSFNQLAVGPHCLAIRTDGALFAWGYNNFGQLGDGTTTSRSSPVVIGAQSWKSISVNGGFSRGASIAGGASSGVRTDGLLYTWGGSGSFNSSGAGESSPVQMRAGTSYIGTAVGEAGGAFRGAALQQ